MKKLMGYLSALNGLLEYAKSIPHTKETLPERRDVWRKCNELIDKMDNWDHLLFNSVFAALGDDFSSRDDYSVNSVYPTPESVEREVNRFSENLLGMLSSMDDIIKAAEKHNMSESLRKRMESADKLLSITVDYFEDATTRY